MSPEPVHHNVFDGSREILDKHCLDSKDLDIVIDGFRKLSAALSETFTEEEADKFREATKRISEIIANNQGEN